MSLKYSLNTPNPNMSVLPLRVATSEHTGNILCQGGYKEVDRLIHCGYSDWTSRTVRRILLDHRPLLTLGSQPTEIQASGSKCDLASEFPAALSERNPGRALSSSNRLDEWWDLNRLECYVAI